MIHASLPRLHNRFRSFSSSNVNDTCSLPKIVPQLQILCSPHNDAELAHTLTSLTQSRLDPRLTHSLRRTGRFPKDPAALCSPGRKKGRRHCNSRPGWQVAILLVLCCFDQKHRATVGHSIGSQTTPSPTTATARPDTHTHTHTHTKQTNTHTHKHAHTHAHPRSATASGLCTVYCVVCSV